MPARFTHRVTTKADGRYAIYYEFGRDRQQQGSTVEAARAATGAASERTDRETDSLTDAPCQERDG
jgi:hypothetical protein